MCFPGLFLARVVLVVASCFVDCNDELQQFQENMDGHNAGLITARDAGDKLVALTQSGLKLVVEATSRSRHRHTQVWAGSGYQLTWCWVSPRNIV